MGLSHRSEVLSGEGVQGVYFDHADVDRVRMEMVPTGLPGQNVDSRRDSAEFDGFKILVLLHSPVLRTGSYLTFHHAVPKDLPTGTKSLLGSPDSNLKIEPSQVRVLITGTREGGCTTISRRASRFRKVSLKVVKQ